jgi:hypothetical protein
MAVTCRVGGMDCNILSSVDAFYHCDSHLTLTRTASLPLQPPDRRCEATRRRTSQNLGSVPCAYCSFNCCRIPTLSLTHILSLLFPVPLLNVILFLRRHPHGLPV